MTQNATFHDITGKSVYITGGGSGIGASLTDGFLAQGANVAFIGRSDATAFVAEMEAKHGRAPLFLQGDITDTKHLQATMRQAAKAHGGLDVLVNNAANDDRHSWQEVTPAYWDERLQTNLRHQFFAIQSVAPGMIAAGGGSIINMGSNSWHETGGGFPAYATSKAAVHGLTRTMARDLGEHRIRVNTVVPGWIMTDRQKQLWATPETLEKQRQRQCLPDLIEPVYVARMVIFLASDDASMCSANNYMVEGGSI